MVCIILTFISFVKDKNLICFYLDSTAADADRNEQPQEANTEIEPKRIKR
jgi:hypothetical protein